MLTAGSYSVGGGSYTYRSSTVAANAALAQGAYPYSISQLGLGSVDTKADIVSAATVFGACGTRSTLVQSGATITVTLGTRNIGAVRTSVSLAAMTWTPSSQATDRAGNPIFTCPITESGLGDPPF